MFNKRAFIVVLVLLSAVPQTLSVPRPREKLFCDFCQWAVGFILDHYGPGESAGELAAAVCAADDWNISGAICTALVYELAEHIIEMLENDLHVDPLDVCKDVDLC
uniref:Saposin B-type domain-containing protein n=1 Tax=Plectus sambesii TaxID=2011161 RepID=A0A914XTR2_9BILA